MARQEGIIPIQGTIGNLTFYKTPSGRFGVKARKSVSAKTIAKSPKYVRTRENMAEFTSGAEAANLVLNTFRTILSKAKDRTTYSRLFGEMRNVIVSDSTSD